jgi:tRNA threonylcarbamoyl adenosine modification protein YeaZ
MRLLLDSSGAQLVCALADGLGIIHELREPARPPEGRDIGQIVGEAIGELRPKDLKCVIVGLGPGSFIGTRVAVSFANGFCAVGHTRLFGVNSLAAIGALYGNGRSVVLRDARRGQFYLHCAWGEAQPTRLCNTAELPALLAQLRVRQLLLEDAPGQSPGIAPSELAVIRDACSAVGAQLLQVPGVPAEGLRRLEAGASAAKYVEPIYLRGWI